MFWNNVLMFGLGVAWGQLVMIVVLGLVTKGRA